VENKIPMADSIILATARLYGATVWTLDEDFSGLPDVRFYQKK
jgi:predicted nucleic acid-binding protein